MTTRAELENSHDIVEAQPGPQTKFLQSSADIAFYGGSAGGGKTYALLLEPLYDIHNKDFGAVIFRRTTKQVTSEGGLWDTAMDVYAPLGARPNQNDLTLKFPHGSKVTFAHMEHEKNRLDWQGSQIPLIGFDEITRFTWKQFVYMLSRNRSASGAKSRIRGTCNPDPDSWVRRFIDWWIDENGYAIPERSGVVRYFVIEGDDVIWADTPDELTEDNPKRRPRSFTFIRSSVEDNKILLEKDPDYLANLQALTRVERAQLMDGNWNIRATAGSFFRRSDFEIVDAAPADLRIVRAWDQAGTEKNPKKQSDDPDWTVGFKMGVAPNGVYYCLTMERFRVDASKVDGHIKNTASQDGKAVKVRLAQDPGQAGKSQARAQAKMLTGFIVNTKPVSGDKTVRAKPFASQVQANNVKVVRGSWNEDFFNELEAFPLGAHDDIVDAASDAFDELNQPEFIFA